MISHLVLFAPKATLTLTEKRVFAQTLSDVGRRLPTIRRGSVGRAVDIDAGYEREMGGTTYPYAAVLEFDSREDLVAYLQHPAHAELGRLFWEYCERSIVTEVETRPIASDDLVDFLLG